MKKYIEIIERETKKVEKRFDVSDKSERSIDRIELGMNINLNHTEYHTDLVVSETELPII